jgi:hypothetical protein
MIIGISGRIGAGKDASALLLQNIFKQRSILLEKKQFAGKLKQFVASLIGCTLEQLEDQDFKKSVLPNEWNRVVKGVSGFNYGAPIYEEIVESLTVREMLISIGHGVRVNTHPDVWINGLLSDYKLQPHLGPTRDLRYPNWIIPDMRYPNEANRIKDLEGFTIRVQRDSVPVMDHPSETLLDAYSFDILIENNGSLDDLRAKLEQAVDLVILKSN